MFADFDTTTYDSATEVSEWRGRGWRHGWRRHRRVDAGDVIAGVLILGGIAAIADAASKNKRRDRDYDYERREDRRYDPRYDRREDRRYDRRERPNNGARGLEGAVNQCVEEIERDVRVETVDGVDRTAQGWIVTGSLFNGSNFNCAIDNDGKIDTIEYGEFSRSGYQSGSANGAERADGQWDDDRYFAARRTEPASVPTVYGATHTVPVEQRPAYPGGPLPGEDDGE